MVAYAKPKNPYISPEAYLERERDAVTKSEYCAGEIVAMAGASPEHNSIVINIVGELFGQLRDKCRLYSNDMRVSIPKRNRYYYPDITLVCKEPVFENKGGVQSLLNPLIVIEVLSDSTERTDRKEKFDGYWALDSLETYVLVSQDSTRVEVFHRLQNGTWQYRVLNESEESLELPTAGATLCLSDIYRGVFPLPLEPETEEEA